MRLSAFKLIDLVEMKGDTEEVSVKPVRVGCVRDEGEKWGDKKGNNK